MDKSAFDLFSGLSSLSGGNKSWYNDLTPEGQKAASPFVMARWMTGTSDAAQIVRINTFVNPYLFSGTADKNMLFGLLAVSATGKSKRYNWIKAPGSKTKSLSSTVISEFYNCSIREAKMYSVQNDDVIEMAEELGWDVEDIKKLKKEIQPDPPVKTKGKK
jgi:hypothetical protein